MSLSEAMRAHTVRQLRGWLAWLRLEMEEPSRGDYYLMQLTQQVIAGNLKGTKRSIPSLNQLRLRRKQEGEAVPTGVTKEQATEWAKLQWANRIPKELRIPEEERARLRALRPPRINPLSRRRTPLQDPPVESQ